ncbi:MAG TPA: hypothetical protein VG297_21685 [Bryobacteraceae bacterium]|nr:hypothetical protein [Bryobacteraceae bacterium]
MKRLLVLFGACIVAAHVAPAADLPGGDSLMQKYIDRSGGAEAYANAKNVAMSGRVEMAAQNIGGTVEIFEEGEKSYTALDFAGIGKIEEGYDGTYAWQNSVLQGPRLLEGDEALSAKRAAQLALITSWRDVYKNARTLGSEDVDGKPAWKVEMTPKEGKPETFYFDKDSGMLVRVAAVFSTPLGDISTDSTMSDFRLVDGILTPFLMTEKAIGQNIVMKFSRVAYNATMPAGRFDLPESVQSLVAKKKQ